MRISHGALDKDVRFVKRYSCNGLSLSQVRGVAS